jgi:hypothetical protein
MVWGQGYGGGPSSAALDPFAVAERDTRAMVSAGWWPATPAQQRQHLVAGRMLALPDGTWWLFGAWGRWYRWTPGAGQWHLCPPPQLSITRTSARSLQQGMPVPQIPPHLVPTGPDLAHEPPPALAFVDHRIRPEVTSRVRATLESAAALPVPDYPHRWDNFSSAAPSTVAVAWGVMLWSAVAPVFDARLDSQLLGLWSPYRSRPLPQFDGPRWLTPPPLEALIGLYAERLRAGRVDSAVVILRTMWAMASALRDDSRFRARADALLAMLGTTLQNPTVDYGALPYGDQALVQQWLTRCSPALTPALRVEASAGEHFRNAYYDLAAALTPVAGNPAEPGYLEPRLISAALLAADLAVVRQDVSGQVVGWLDPEVSAAMQAMLVQQNHPLRRLWPEGNRLPWSLRERLESVEPSVRDTLLATMYSADLAWCRLGGGIPARPRGFPVPVAILAEILGPQRAMSSAAAEPVTPVPGVASPAHHYPANPMPTGQPAVAPMAHRPPTGPPGQAPAWASPAASRPPPATEAWSGSGEREVSIPLPPPATEAWTGSGEREVSVPLPPPATQAWTGPPEGAREPVGEEGGRDLGNATMLDPVTPSPPDQRSPHATYIDRIDGTRVDAGAVPAVAPSPVPPPPAAGPRTWILPEPGGPAERPRTRVMSGTMIGGLLGAPMPERPVDQIEPPPAPAPMPEVAERFGIHFVSGADDVSELLDELRRKASAHSPSDPETAATHAPALLIVGAAHSGQRRFARLVARTLAGVGAGDGSVRTVHAAELRGEPAQAVAATLRGDGTPLLFERLDAAVLDASDPELVAAAVTRSRENEDGRTALIATCEPEPYARLAARFPELTGAFEVFRLPDFADTETRLALTHVLADERRVTINAAALGVVRADLPRLRGRGDLIGARLVEAYLDGAVARHTERAGVSRDRLVLAPVDFAGLAEEIEPALRPPRDVDGFLRTLGEMIGLDEVKQTVDGLVAEARMAADRAARGLPSGNPSRHLIFLGRPGTGKTTVAGLIGGIYAALNLLDSGHLVACSAREFAGEDAAAKVAAQVDRAGGGVLLIEDAHLLDPASAAVAELLRLMDERRDKFTTICAGRREEMERFLLADPGFRAEFGAIVEFGEPADRQLVQLFSRLAERELYLLDEELRVELLDRFRGMRGSPGFAFADTVRRLFDQIVARQAARLAGAQVDTMDVARLSVRDLPESPGGQLLQSLHEDRSRGLPR